METLIPLSKFTRLNFSKTTLSPQIYSSILERKGFQILQENIDSIVESILRIENPLNYFYFR
ncbi:MAG: hypothetical protein DRJ47_08295 [Thermoprotei archaeon]|nr:MAG: hypothetical protein DRJ47_08295 [Thermoprotei archaeon]